MEKNGFVPSPSIDSKTQPMEVHMLLSEGNSDEEDTVDTESTIKAVVNYNEKRKSRSTPEKTPHHEKQPNVRLSPVQNQEPSKPKKQFVRVGQVKSISFYQALASEFIGTMILTIICTGTGLPIATKPIPDLHGSLASGFIVATIVVGFGHASGAHINPAVTLTFLVTLEIDLIRAVSYIAVQLLGAMCGSVIVGLVTPSHAYGNLGMTLVTDGVTLPQAVLVEFIITFILCYTVLAICDKHRDDIGGSKALAVGLAVTIGCLFGGPYTGASMNPARSFGPAVIMNKWENHWVYWIGPLSGGIVSAIVYTIILKIKPRKPIVEHHSSNSNHV